MVGDSLSLLLLVLGKLLNLRDPSLHPTKSLNDCKSVCFIGNERCGGAFLPHDSFLLQRRDRAIF